MMDYLNQVSASLIEGIHKALNPFAELLLFFLAPLTALIAVIGLILVVKKSRQKIRDARSEASREIQKIADQSKSEIDGIREEAKRNMEALQAKTAQELAEEKERSKRAIIAEREAIQAERELLLATDDKELLVRSITALAGYASRLDRIESEMNRIGKSVSGDLQQTLNSVALSVQNLSEEISEISSGELMDVPERIDSLREEASGKLAEILEAIHDIDWDIGSLGSSSDLSDIGSNLSSMQETIDSLRWTVDSIENKIQSS